MLNERWNKYISIKNYKNHETSLKLHPKNRCISFKMNESGPSKKEEKSPLKGWNDFLTNINEGFQKFQQSLEEQLKKNQENWEKSKEHAGKFFKKIQEDWQKKINEWDKKVKESQLKNREQWEETRRRIQWDIEKWENKTRKDIKDGLKWWNWQTIKGAYLFLIVMIPIIIVLFLVFYILTKFFPFLFY